MESTELCCFSVFYPLSEGLLHFVFLLQPFGEFLSRCIKDEAIPVKDTERLFVLLSVVNSHEAI